MQIWWYQATKNDTTHLFPCLSLPPTGETILFDLQFGLLLVFFIWFETTRNALVNLVKCLHLMLVVWSGSRSLIVWVMMCDGDISSCKHTHKRLGYTLTIQPCMVLQSCIYATMNSPCHLFWSSPHLLDRCPGKVYPCGQTVDFP